MNPEIVQAFCEEHLTNLQLKRGQLFAACPRCGKEYDHWNIDLDTGVFHCYRCNWSGSFRFLVKYVTGKWLSPEELEDQYETVITLETLEALKTDSKQEIVSDWKEGTVSLDCNCRIARKAGEYLEKRNVSLEQAKELQVVVGIEGKYKGCLIFPIFEDGKVATFVARRFLGKGLRYSGPSRQESFADKSTVVWGLDGVDENVHIVVVEGIFDALVLGENVVALLGKRASPVQVDKILEKAKKVTILLDAEFTEEAYKLAKQFVGFVPVGIAEMELGDPSDFPEEAKQAVESARDFFQM